VRIFSATCNMDLIKKWDWEQLTSISKFRWEVGVTPFSDLWVVFGFMAAYLIVIFGLQVSPYLFLSLLFALVSTLPHYSLIIVCMVAYLIVIFGLHALLLVLLVYLISEYIYSTYYPTL
jgi:hypothetical protein